MVVGPFALSKGFSRKLENHEEAGVADRLWEVSELVRPLWVNATMRDERALKSKESTTQFLLPNS